MLVKLCISSVLLVSLTSHAMDNDDDQKFLRELKTSVWPSAYKNADAELLGSILHDNFKLVDANGETVNKAQELAFLKDYVWPHSKFVYHIDSINITAQNTAVVIGNGKASGQNDEGEYCFTYTSSNVLVKQDGQWQAILSHVSGYAPDCE